MTMLTAQTYLSAVLIVGFTVVGCASNDESQGPNPPSTTPSAQPSPPASSEEVPAPATRSNPESSEGVTTSAPPLWAPEPMTRVRKRLNVDQLGAALWAASDGLKWAQEGDDDLLETLALTLGKPDYMEVTTENLDSNVLFMKFLEDAAGSVCRQMVERDQLQGTDLLLNSDGDDTTHLLNLISKFHSRALSRTHPDVKQWQWLYDSALAISQEPSAAWHTVCVALIRHPDFYSY